MEILAFIGLFAILGALFLICCVVGRGVYLVIHHEDTEIPNIQRLLSKIEKRVNDIETLHTKSLQDPSLARPETSEHGAPHGPGSTHPLF